MKNFKLVPILFVLLLLSIHTLVSAGRHEENLELINRVYMADLAAVTKLLEAGVCDVNYVDLETADSPLSIAVARNATKMVHLLLAHGEKVTIGVGREQLTRQAEAYENQELKDLLTGAQSTFPNK